jgi:hypothetical protein
VSALRHRRLESEEPMRPRWKTTRLVLTCAVGALATSCALTFATVATGRSTVLAQPFASEVRQLEAAASAIAGRPLTVLCYRHGEPGDPLLWGGWGYVDLFRPTINLSKEACDGALGIVNRDVSVPLIQQAVGALSLTHESYHLNLSLPLARRTSEAQTECRAIKRVRQTMLELGASDGLADVLLPWALAVHFKKTTIARSYDWPGCRVPVFADFWG